MEDNSTEYQNSFEDLNESLIYYGESLNDKKIVDELVQPNPIKKYIANKLYSYYLNYKNIIMF